MEDRYLFRAKGDKRYNDGKWYEGYLIKDKDGDFQIFRGSRRSTVLPDTICQCTGLKDKNGNLIWENDVVTGWFDDKRITGYIKYGSNGIFYIERNGLYGIHLDNSQDWLEVIGNIFDNPELLER